MFYQESLLFYQFCGQHSKNDLTWLDPLVQEAAAKPEGGGQGFQVGQEGVTPHQGMEGATIKYLSPIMSVSGPRN